MKTGFKDPAAIKSQKPADQPKEGKDSPWDFRQPQYDERTSCFVKAGTNYGQAYRQPVGHDGPCKPYGVPMGRPNTLKVYEESA
jgi:hypothetical protein